MVSTLAKTREQGVPPATVVEVEAVCPARVVVVDDAGGDAFTPDGDEEHAAMATPATITANNDMTRLNAADLRGSPR
jgi:hypothetical protein